MVLTIVSAERPLTKRERKYRKTLRERVGQNMKGNITGAIIFATGVVFGVGITIIAGAPVAAATTATRK